MIASKLSVNRAANWSQGSNGILLQSAPSNCRAVLRNCRWHYAGLAACALNSVNGCCCSGGGLDVHGSIFQEDSSIFVENCTAKSHGTTAANQIAFHAKQLEAFQCTGACCISTLLLVVVIGFWRVGVTAISKASSLRCFSRSWSTSPFILCLAPTVTGWAPLRAGSGGGVTVGAAFHQKPGSSAHFRNCTAQDNGAVTAFGAAFGTVCCRCLFDMKHC